MSTIINMSFVNGKAVDHSNAGSDEIRTILWNVPKSYDDFVNSTADCMEKDDKLKAVILDLIRTKPESDSGDVLKALCNFYGFNKPLELVEDDEFDGEEEVLVGAQGIRAAAY